MAESPSLRVVAVGDLSFNGRYHRLLETKGSSYPLAPLESSWKGSDLRLGNLESPLTTRPPACPWKLTLRGPSAAVDTLLGARFDALALANNHAMDFGPEGLAETRGLLERAGIPYVGAGDDAESAARPLVVECDGRTIGLLAFCDVEQSSPLYAGDGSPGIAALRTESCCRAILRLRDEVDWVILQLHWGHEMQRLPTPTQRDQARRFVEAGADLILGHHPHVLQPMEVIAGVPVFYSLGNFLFSDMFWHGTNSEGEPFIDRFRIHPESRKTGWAEVVLRKGGPASARFCPARQRRDLSVQPEPTRSREEAWAEMCAHLEGEGYPAEHEAEARRGAERLRWTSSGASLPRRVELKLFQCGLLRTSARAL